VNGRSPAGVGYALVGLLALALFLGGITGDTSDTGSGIGMAVFGALLLSVSVSGLLGVLAGSEWHLAWAFAGLMFPGYSLPVLLYYCARGREERKRCEAALAERLEEELREEAEEQTAAAQRERAAPLSELAERLRRLHADCSEEFRRLPAYESARRFLAEYEASGPSAEAAALAEEAARETREGLSALVADVPEVGRRDFRGERWAPGLKPVESVHGRRRRPTR
jgi:hypothetical protein